MKTAVEWLVYEANKRQCWVDANKMHYLIAEAKELEKQQIVDAYLKSVQHECDGLDNIETASIKEDAENYYTETYK